MKFFLLDFLYWISCKNRNGVMLVNIFFKIFSQFFKIRVECPFNGKLPNLVISSIMPTAQVEYLRLFSHMFPTCKPIKVKGAKFSAADHELIRTETKRLLQEGRIEESNSPWRAQPLIVDYGNSKKRMCIDFSLTVN